MDTLRHSCSHVMADAVTRLFPSARPTIGPSIEDGFYYDFEYRLGFTPDDLARIEREMTEIITSNHPFIREDISKAEARKIFKDNRFKLEIIDELEGDTVTTYRHGSFVDLCKGPHVGATGEIKAFKLLKVAGAYWRGSEKNPMLQRIYGTAFPTKEGLDDHLKKLEEALRRDHRSLGRELELFSTMEEFGPGLVLWHPKGARIRMAIEDFWRDEHIRRGYEIVFTPHIARLDIWRISGHLDFYRENMYSSMDVDGVPYEIKPMNCPFHIQIYRSKTRSWRELPIKLAELGTVYRYERSGVLHGLMRVRGFTQDDAHIFCRPDQLTGEIRGVLDFTTFVLKRFGFDKYEIFLSTKPEKYVGDDHMWDMATEALKSGLEASGLEYKIDPGEGVFYGPKIDIKIKDALDRAWQCSTIQVDFNMPARYEMEYVGSDGAKHQPVMIHRAILGSLERFFGVLIEHYAGDFPLWLAPAQVVVLSITDAANKYVEEVTAKLRGDGIRAELDTRNEKLGLKIREAELQKIPYMLVVGAKEITAGTVAVRSRRHGDLGAKKLEEFVEMVKKEIKAVSS